MSVKTTYTCDKCKESQTMPDQFMVMRVTAHFWKETPQPYSQMKELQLCRSCVESFGWMIVKGGYIEPIPQSRVEDLIREIIERVQE